MLNLRLPSNYYLVLPCLNFIQSTLKRDLYRKWYVLRFRCEYRFESFIIELLQAGTLRSIEESNSAIPQDKLMGLDSYREAVKTLFEIWSANVEKLVKEFVRFAKQIPGFSALTPDDQITLIKAARPDIQVLIKFKHFRRSPDAFVDFLADSQTMCLIPTRMVRLIFNGSVSPKSDYSALYGR